MGESPAEAIASLADAARALPLLHALVTEISSLVSSSNAQELQREADYAAKVTPKLEAATSQYQALASFLQEHKKEFAHDKQFRSVQREYVEVMQQLQKVQRESAARREQLCDADFLSSSQVTSVDLQRAKEEVAEAGQIATEAVIVKQLFQTVSAAIVEQGKGVDQIQHKVENIRIEIGNGVNELQHARRLQKEAQHKYLICVLVFLLVLAAVVIPIVVSVI
ncbi:hypothetical protein Gpo141_00001276 [Globisporangium polare]